MTPPLTPVRACDLPARSLEAIAALLATPIATPSATTGGRTLPAGEPVSEEQSSLIAETVQIWLACQNAGEPLRAWSLFTDGYLYRLLARQGVAPGEFVATPAVTDGRAVLLEVRGERRLPDGRLGALVTIAYPSVPMPKSFFFSFVEDDDRLLIDGILGEISFSVP